jgi:hypothetical protein
MSRITRTHIEALAAMESFSAKDAERIVRDCGADVVSRLKHRKGVVLEKLVAGRVNVRYRLTIVGTVAADGVTSRMSRSHSGKPSCVAPE